MHFLNVMDFFKIKVEGKNKFINEKFPTPVYNFEDRYPTVGTQHLTNSRGGGGGTLKIV